MEEYRQPWENEGQWELKKEFLKYYKDFLPEEKLISFAEIYSNMELFQYSYPEEVMKEVQKLALHLKAFCNETEAEPQKVGKKPEECEKEESKTKKQEHEAFVPLPPGLQSVCYKSIAQSENFEIVQKLGGEVEKLLQLQKENAFDIILSAALHLNIEDLIDVKYTDCSKEESDSYFHYYCEFFVGATKLSVCGGENRYIAKKKASEISLDTLANLSLVEKLGAQVEKEIKKASCFENSYEVLLAAVIELGVEDVVKFTSSSHLKPGSLFRYRDYEISVGAIKMSSGTGSSRFTCKRKASDNCLYILTHLRDLPKGDLVNIRVALQNRPYLIKEDSKKKWDKELLGKLAFEVKRLSMKSLGHVSLLVQSFTRIGRREDLAFNFYKVNGVGTEEFLCKVLVNNAPLAQGKSLHKKNAKELASKDLINLFLDLFKLKNKLTVASEDIYARILNLFDTYENVTHPKPFSHDEAFCKKTFGRFVSDKVTNEKKPNLPFKLNKRLYSNSIKQKLLLYDTTNVDTVKIKSFCGDLVYAAQQVCRHITYKFIDQNNGTIRCDILMDGKVLGSAVSVGRQNAKIEAAKLILDKLRQEIYTIKILKSEDSHFVVNIEDLRKLRHRKDKRKIYSPVNRDFAKSFQYYADHCDYVNLDHMPDKIRTLMEGLSKSKSLDTLVFRPDDFKIPDRRIFFQYVKKYRLFQSKRGKDLYVWRRVTVKERLDYLIKYGGRTEKYELLDLST